MAAAVTTTTNYRKSSFGSRRAVFATLAFDTGDYAAGGIALTAAQFGLRVIDSISFQGAVLDVAATPTALLPRWVPTAVGSNAGGKIQLFEAATAGASFTEKPAEAMGAGATVAVLVIGH